MAAEEVHAGDAAFKYPVFVNSCLTINLSTEVSRQGILKLQVAPYCSIYSALRKEALQDYGTQESW